MAEFALTLGCALLAFGPFLSLFFLVIYPKAQLVIVVTSAAFFFLLGSVAASFSWWVFDSIGLDGPLAAIIPGVFFQFIARCVFVALYHRVERVIQITLHKQQQNDSSNDSRSNNTSNHNDTDATARRVPRAERQEDWHQAARLRLALNDASCGVAAGVGFGGMHAIMLYGTLLASQTTNNVGVLYQDSCPAMPSLVVSGLFAFFFTILDVFWMLFTFFGMRRRLMYPRGHTDAQASSRQRAVIGGLLGNSRTGGNLALLFCLISHFVASLLTTSDYFKFGCSVSVSAVGVAVLVSAYCFWAGVGRIYMPPPQSLTLISSMSRAEMQD